MRTRSFGMTKFSPACFATGVALGSCCTTNPAYADKFVNSAMAYAQINSIIASATPGETVHFAGGTAESPAVYQLPFSPGNNAFYYLNNQGVALSADGTVMLRGGDSLGDIVLRVGPNANGNLIQGFTIENGYLAIHVVADLTPSAPIEIRDNVIQNITNGIFWANKLVIDSNVAPSLVVAGNQFKNIGEAGVNFEETFAANEQTAWAIIINNTFEAIRLLVFAPPIFCPGGSSCTSSQIALMGLCEFDGNVIVNSDGAVLPDQAFQGVCWREGVTAGGADFPNANGEWQDCLNPDPSYPCIATLAEAWGGHNFVDDPLFNWARRPLPGSPLIGVQYLNADGTVRGYGGAYPPAGDWNGDGILNDFDQALLEAKKTGPGVPAPIADRVVFDFDGDGDIDNEDHAVFLQAYVGTAPGIPTVSTWGFIALALTILAAGSAALHRRATQPRQ